MLGGADLPQDWIPYDEVAESYDRLVELNGYARLGTDLIALLEVPRGGSALDVGCGTGAATRAACDAVGPEGTAVGLDPSLPMLRRASARGIERLVAGSVPGLPFRDRVFDCVAASLVLSHVERYQAALGDMARVLRPGGRLGVTAWARGGRAGPAYRLWEEAAAAAVGKDALSDAFHRVVPWEEWLGDPAHVTEVLAEAGLRRVEVQQREYRVSLTLHDYVSMIGVFTYGRFIRRLLGAARWREFSESVAEKLHTQCGERIEYTSRYHLGVGERSP